VAATESEATTVVRAGNNVSRSGSNWTPTARIGWFTIETTWVEAKHRSTCKRVTRTRSRRRTAPAHRLTAMAVGDEGQVPEYAKAGFGNTDGDGRVTPATTCTLDTAGESPAKAGSASNGRCEPDESPCREGRRHDGRIRRRPCGPGKTSPVQAQTGRPWHESAVTQSRQPG
jgi:hypothetical protein